jgi:hypothetical protein
MSLNKKFLNKTAAVPVVEDTFNTLIYDGNNSSQSITGLGFQPDLLWIKQRGGTNPNGVWDSTRGAGKLITTNTANAESGNAGDFVGSFDADVFEVNRNYLTYTAHDTTNYGVGAGAKYVAWAWKANGGTTSSNTDGSITTTVQANVAAGFSIITYTGDGAATSTIGHGLDSAPELVLVKTRSHTSDWPVYSSATTNAGYRLVFNSSAAESTTNNPWNSAAPTSTIINLGSSGNVNVSLRTFVAYAFHSVAGYSKISSYTGTQSSLAITGMGFQPDYVMIKEVDGIDSWEVYDSVRGNDKVLYPNGSNAEGTGSNFTSFDTDGFTVSGATSVNESGKTYLYMAFKINVS